MDENVRPLIWVGSSKKDLLALPDEVRRFFGHALHFAQNGERHESAKVMKGFGGAGVLEIVEDASEGAFRAVYTVRFKGAVFVPPWDIEEGDMVDGKPFETSEDQLKVQLFAHVAVTVYALDSIDPKYRDIPEPLGVGEGGGGI